MSFTKVTKKPKMLFFVRGYLIDGPQSTRARYLVKYLSTFYDIDILCFDYKNRVIEPTENIHVLNYGFIWRTFFLSKSTHCSSIRKTITRLMSKILDLLIYPDPLAIEKSKIIRAIQEMLDKKNYDVVIGSAYPFATYEIGKTVKKHHSAPYYLLDVGDPLFGNSALRTFPGVNYFRKCYEGPRLSLADHILVTNEGTKDLFSKTYAISSDKITVIPQGFDSFLIPTDNNEEHILKTDNPLKMIYAGLFYRKLREPKALFSAITSMQGEFCIDVYSEDSYFNLPSPYICFRKPLIYSQILKKYQEYDVLVFIDNAWGLQTSGKIYELIAAKRPILFIYEDEKSPTKKMIKEYLGIVLSKNNKDDILNALKIIKKSYKKFSFDFHINEHTWEARALKLNDVIKRVIDYER